MKKGKKGEKIPIEIPLMAAPGQPYTVADQLNKYGTYEIQPTSDSDNRFPEIAQGLPEKKKDEGHGKWGRE